MRVDDEECWICICAMSRLKRKVISFKMEKLLQFWSLLWCIQCFVGGSIYIRVENLISALRYHIILGWISVLIVGPVFVSVHMFLYLSDETYLSFELGLLIVLSIMTASLYTCRQAFHSLQFIPSQRPGFHRWHTHPLSLFLLGLSQPRISSNSSLHTFRQDPCYDRNLLGLINTYL